MERGSGPLWNVPSVNQDLVLIHVHTGGHPPPNPVTQIGPPSPLSPVFQLLTGSSPSVSGGSADVSAAKRLSWGGFIQVSAAHTPSSSVWMKTITVSVFLFLLSPPLVGSPLSQSHMYGWMDGYESGDTGFCEPGESFSCRRLQKTILFFKDKGGVLKIIIGREKHKANAVSICSFLHTRSYRSTCKQTKH